ncbi:MAG: tol-pal system protein YbgF [Betaproteobacteria bacterium]|nr:MAG: tol-pal system protein YbgF [Betaproteobacteria bacterium]
MKRQAALLLGLCLAAGPARAGMFDDEEARKAITALRAQVEASQKTGEERLVKIETGLARIETLVQDRSIDLARQIDELKQELARMRGQIEVQAHQVETLDRRQKDLYVDLDARLRKLEAGAQAQEKQAASTPDPAVEGKAYEAALNQFKLGNYQSSIAAFQSFLAGFPQSQQVSNAQYWIGNAYYELRDYKMAIAAQQKLLASWPDSAKAPDALLNVASSQSAMGETRAARETLQALQKKYPGTPAAEQAKQRASGKR